MKVLSSIVIVFLSVVVIYQGTVMQKQHKALGVMDGALDHCISQVVVASDAAVHYSDKLQECRMFSDACHAAYKECSTL